MTPRIILITGISAAGKSTVAQALAERLSNSVHLRGDAFRKMIVNGQAEMSMELSEEARRQLWLRYELATTAARRYFADGFTVVYQDIFVGEALDAVLGMLGQLPVTLFVLCPDPAAVEVREAARRKSAYRRPGEVAAFDRVLREATPRLGIWIDSTHLTVTETVDRILSELEIPT